MEGDLGWWRGGSSNNNWDLHAVVRFACGGAGQGAPSSPPPSDRDISSPSSWQQQLISDPPVDDLRQALSMEPPKPETAASPRTEEPRIQQPTPAGKAPAAKTRYKRRKKKSQVNKEVRRVPAGGTASADPWAWRKYGQKPIKGSPYPRSYYRCSTDKDCKARKQVESCRADPANLVITYTGEHSHPVPLHRNSLAGTTRGAGKSQKTPPSSPPAEESQHQQALSDPAGLSPSLADDTNTSRGSSPFVCASGLLSPCWTPPSVGVEYEEDGGTLAVRLPRLEDMVVTEEDDALMRFLQPDEPAPVVPGGGGCDDGTMLQPNKPEEPSPAAVGSGAGASDSEDDVMFFPKPSEPQQGAVIPFVDDDKFPVSDLEAASANQQASHFSPSSLPVLPLGVHQEMRP